MSLAARLRQPHVDPRRLQGGLRRGDAVPCTACRTCACRSACAKRNIGTPHVDARARRGARALRDRVGDERAGRARSRWTRSSCASSTSRRSTRGASLPFSSRHLLECFALGAEKFGWARRTPAVGSMRRDGLTLGWGMAGCAWVAARFAAQANVRAPRRRHGARRVRHAGHRHRHLHDPRAARRGADRRAARQGRGRPRRHGAAGRPDLGRLDGDRVGGARGVPGGRRRDRLAAPAGGDHAGLAVRAAPARGPDPRRRAGARQGRRGGAGRAVRGRPAPGPDAPRRRQRPGGGHVRQPRGEVLHALVRRHFVEVTWQPETRGSA